MRVCVYVCVCERASVFVSKEKNYLFWMRNKINPNNNNTFVLHSAFVNTRYMGQRQTDRQTEKKDKGTIKTNRTYSVIRKLEKPRGMSHVVAGGV